MRVLVTGGAGYIGSHTLVELLTAGHDVTVVDSLINSSVESIKRVEKITGKSIDFHEFDLRDHDRLAKLFEDSGFEAVIHFAGLKAVGESVEKPLLYYDNNIGSSIVLLETMAQYQVHKLVFSSSATVYGNPTELPLSESAPIGVGLTNPYGKTKYMIEEILRDLAVADKAWNFTILRYFNPVGAHPSGKIGEDPQGIPNNLLPYISQTAIGKREKLTVNGNDYATPDGTCVRDYIHVVDLARGHVAALNHMQPGCEVYNLGTGKGTSVLEAIAAFSHACGHSIPYIIGPRRLGDIASCYASPGKAADKLGWKAEKTFAEACVDAWHWQSQNPHGYLVQP